MRDDFTKTVKDALAARAGNHCSFPGCTNITQGPSEESKIAVSNTGMACHIASASGGSGARRYDPSMSREQRKSINNGIWMCYVHGKLIDTDEEKYSIEILNQWKKISEKKAEVWQMYGEDYIIGSDMLREIGLPDDFLHISGVGKENILIGELLRNSRVDELWGVDLTHAMRDLLVELVRNAFQHGGATKSKIVVSRKSIDLYDNGGDYSVWDLYKHSGSSGGSIAAKHVVDCIDLRLLIVADRLGDQNHTLLTFVDDPLGVQDLTECALEVSWNELRSGKTTYQVHELCRSKCIILPPYMSISDAITLRRKIPIDDGRPVVFVLSETSSKAQEILESNFPESLVVRL